MAKSQPQVKDLVYNITMVIVRECIYLVKALWTRPYFKLSQPYIQGLYDKIKPQFRWPKFLQKEGISSHTIILTSESIQKHDSMTPMLSYEPLLPAPPNHRGPKQKNCQQSSRARQHLQGGCQIPSINPAAQRQSPP